MMIQHTLGKNIRRLREARKWSQEELADQAGLHRTYISGIERGIRNPTIQIVEDLARALNTTASMLVHKTGDDSK